jgi:hypothetical protein
MHQTPAANPNRPTPTWKLWLMGLAGAIVLIGVISLTGGTADDATRIGQWSIRLLLIAVLILGGWEATRRRTK